MNNDRSKVKVKSLSRVRLFVTLWTVEDQAPASMGFSRQEYWSGLLFASPMHESEVAHSCLILSLRMYCSLPGTSVHGIFQARVLEWTAISFSRNLPDPGNEPGSPALQADALPSKPTGKPMNVNESERK